ncbi:MAG TPA: iron chaperone [Tissierellaceae bacterium]|nr:iron chaperone [Tissierellaceae bacterium]
MDTFKDYLMSIDNIEYRQRLEEIFIWILDKFPSLETRIAWNQPMFTDHGTFIIGFSISKKHMAVSPETATIEYFADDITKSGYDYSKMIIRIPWTSPVDFELLGKMIEFNIIDKADYTKFWR